MSWIDNIQGIRTLKSFLGTVFQQRSVLKVGGLPVSDNGSETVINGVQTITGSGTWDGFSGIVLVKGSGVRTIAIPDPTDLAPGTIISFFDAAGNSSGGNTITLDPAGSGTLAGSATLTIANNFTMRSFIWISPGVWGFAT
jgi:hypothetical protein